MDIQEILRKGASGVKLSTPELNELVNVYNQYAPAYQLEALQPLQPRESELSTTIDPTIAGTLSGGPLGTLSKGISDLVGKKTPSLPQISRRDQALLDKGILGNLPVVGDKVLPKAYESLSPKNFGESLLYGTAEAAPKLATALGVNALIPGAGVASKFIQAARGFATGAGVEALSNPSTHLQNFATAMGEAESPLDKASTAIVGATDTALRLGGSGAWMGGLGAVQGAVRSVFVKSPALKRVFEGVLKKHGPAVANRLMNTAHTTAQIIAGGTAPAIVDAFRDIPTHQKIANMILGAGFDAVGPKLPEMKGRLKNAGALAESTIKKLTPEYKNQKLLGYSPEEVNNYNNQVNAQVNKIKRLTKKQVQKNLTGIVSKGGTGDLVDEVRSLRAAQELATSRGDQDLADRLGGELEGRLAKTPEHNELVQSYLSTKKAHADLITSIEQRTGIDIAPEAQKNIVASESLKTQKTEALEAYIKANTDFAERVEKLYGEISPEEMPKIIQEIEARAQGPLSESWIRQDAEELVRQAKEISTGKRQDNINESPIVSPGRMAVPESTIKKLAEQDIITQQVVAAVNKTATETGITQAVQSALAQDLTSPIRKVHAAIPPERIPVIDQAVRAVKKVAGEIKWSLRDLNRNIIDAFGVDSPIRTFVIDGLLDARDGAMAMTKVDISKLWDGLKKAGMDIKGNVWSNKEMARLVDYRERNLEHNKGKNFKFTQAEITKFEQADKLLQGFFDEYYTRINRIRSIVGLDPIKKVENYVTWMRDMDRYGLDWDSVETVSKIPGKNVSRKTLAFEKIRGKIAPRFRTPLPILLEKYATAVNLADAQLPVVHTIHRIRDSFTNLAKEKAASDVGGDIVKSDLPLDSASYEAMSNRFDDLANKLKGTIKYTGLDRFIKNIPLVAKITSNWSSQVTTTPRTILSQMFGIAPIVAEVGPIQTTKAFGEQLASQFFGEISDVVRNPSLLVSPQRDSLVYRTRGYEPMFKHPKEKPVTRAVASIGETIGHAVQFADRVLVGAAYRAGYKQAYASLKNANPNIPPAELHEKSRIYGDVMAGRTQAIFETVIRPAILQGPAARFALPLSTSAFANANSFAEAIGHDLRMMKGKEKLTAPRAGVFFATSFLLALAQDTVLTGFNEEEPSREITKALTDAAWQMMPVISNVVRYGSVGPLRGISTAATNLGKDPVRAITAAIPYFNVPPGTMQLLNTLQGVMFLKDGGIKYDRNGNTIYSIDPDNIADIARAFTFGPLRTSASAERLDKMNPNLIDSFIDFYEENSGFLG